MIEVPLDEIFYPNYKVPNIKRDQIRQIFGCGFFMGWYAVWKPFYPMKLISMEDVLLSSLHFRKQWPYNWREIKKHNEWVIFCCKTSGSVVRLTSYSPCDQFGIEFLDHETQKEFKKKNLSAGNLVPRYQLSVLETPQQTAQMRFDIENNFKGLHYRKGALKCQ